MRDYINDMRAYFRAGSHNLVKKGRQLEVFSNADNRIHYLAAGYMRMYVTNNRGEQFTHIIYGPGDIYPLSWMNAQQIPGLTGEALTDVELYCIERETFSKDLEADNALTLGMLQQTVEQYRNYSMRVSNLEFKYASERLGFRLLSLAGRFGERSGDSLTILPPLTHQILGSSINLSRESVSREMEKLLRRNLVKYNASRQIVIPDPTALAQYLQIPRL